MTRREKILAAIILIQALSMPVLTRYFFRQGMRTAAELGLRIVVRPPPMKVTL